MAMDLFNYFRDLLRMEQAQAIGEIKSELAQKGINDRTKVEPADDKFHEICYAGVQTLKSYLRSNPDFLVYVRYADCRDIVYLIST